MQALLQKNKLLLRTSYDVDFNGFSRKTVFESVDRYKNNLTTANLQVAISMILSWGDYNVVIGRYRKITAVDLVNSVITDDYANKFHQLFLLNIEKLSPRDCFRLFDSALRIETVSYAYFTKILYFFSSREKGLLILDKWLVLNSMKLAIDYQDEYATKWYNKVTPNGECNYNGVKAEMYEDYINFMQRAKTQLNLDYADELETLLFGWRNKLNKKFLGYDNPRTQLFADVTFIPDASFSNSNPPSRNKTTQITGTNARNNLAQSDLELLCEFIQMKPKGTMDFAVRLGHAQGSPEYTRIFTTLNKILKNMQTGASCATFFNVTLPAIRARTQVGDNQFIRYIQENNL